MRLTAGVDMSPRQFYTKRAVLGMLLLLFTSPVARAESLNINFDVPAAAATKIGAGGWGALVLTFDRAITASEFIFNPECPTPMAGINNVGDMTTLLRPMTTYALLPTGSTVEDGVFVGQIRGQMQVTITYFGGLAPNILDAFWKSKPGSLNDPNFAFNPAVDLRVVPEPSTFVLLLCILLGLSVTSGRRIFMSWFHPRMHPAPTNSAAASSSSDCCRFARS